MWGPYRLRLTCMHSCLKKINQTEATTGEYANAAKQSAGAAKASEDKAAKSAADAAKAGPYAEAALNAQKAAEAARDTAISAGAYAENAANAAAGAMTLNIVLCLCISGLNLKMTL